MEEINGVRNLLAKKDIIRNLAYLFFATFVWEAKPKIAPHKQIIKLPKQKLQLLSSPGRQDRAVR
jgi:hypothetical protein